MMASTLGPSESMTFAEARVAVLLLEGKTPRQMCDELSVALPTVRSHLRALHFKADLHSLPALIRWCWRYLEAEIAPAVERDAEWRARAFELLTNR